MDYRQVKERVEREDRALKRIVVETGLLMLAGTFVMIFLCR